jgi:hypothetical protein
MFGLATAKNPESSAKECEWLTFNHATLESVWANGESDWHINAKDAAKEAPTAPRDAASGDDPRPSPLP